MGGSAKKVKKETKKAISAVAPLSIFNKNSRLRKEMGRISGEEFMTGGASTFFFEPLHKATGIKVPSITGEIGKKFIDKPKQARQEARDATRDASVAQEKSIRELKGRKAQEAAEKEASASLVKSRAKQKRRGRKGRGSTILTDDLGGVGGVAGQGLKSLLGQ